MKRINVEQGTEEWKQLRKTHIGSSDIAVIIGLKPYGKTQYDLYKEKKNTQESKSNYAMERGTELEPIARESYMNKTGNIVIPCVAIDEENPYIASLDGITFDDNLIVEIKCPLSLKSMELARNEAISPIYYAQIQWQLMITGAKMAHLWIYHPECDAVMKEVFPDLEYQEKLREEADKFWTLIENEVEPEMEMTEYLHIDSPEYIEATEEYKFIDKQLKDLEIKKQIAREKVVDCSDGGSFEGNGIKGIWSQPKITVNWKSVCERFNIKEEDLLPFSKQGEGFLKISVIKN